MKKLLFVFAVASLLSSCKTTSYTGSLGQVTQTQVVLTGSNFKVLGSFSGTASEKIEVIGIKNRQGLVAQAKANMLANAKSAGVDLTGSRALVNVAVDVIQNKNRVTTTVSAEIIEFSK